MELRKVMKVAGSRLREKKINTTRTQKIVVEGGTEAKHSWRNIVKRYMEKRVFKRFNKIVIPK